MLNEDLREILLDILYNHEYPEKIHVELVLVSRSLNIYIDDLDDEWFNELKKAGAQISQL